MFTSATFFILISIQLLIRQSYREREKLFYQLVHSPGGHNDQGWIKPKSRVRCSSVLQYGQQGLKSEMTLNKCTCKILASHTEAQPTIPVMASISFHFKFLDVFPYFELLYKLTRSISCRKDKNLLLISCASILSSASQGPFGSCFPICAVKLRAFILLVA